MECRPCQHENLVWTQGEVGQLQARTSENELALSINGGAILEPVFESVWSFSAPWTLRARVRRDQRLVGAKSHAVARAELRKENCVFACEGCCSVTRR